MAKVKPERGEVWWVDWSPDRGSEQAGRRPALVVQTNPANHNPDYPNTIVVTISRQARDVPFHVRVEPTARNGLSSQSFIKCEQILTISKERLETRMGCVTEVQLEQVNAAMRMVLAL
ncbi:MAG: type II toxin-antitoxin system PemK/MazF family toxin [Deltaproteobacteria bacterium]|nr:type II toxin-antitoxin system PemK/MazF family toxin [Deltaproteobacteria bacterium]